ncbi:MAG: L-aspartate oxidase [Candidatus Aminicenantes bacterium RBG_16_66_30]|nr:MAG: L-aspartate oxidase [Candidatus Aminicenantes bacterium RBG_16_66_30]
MSERDIRADVLVIGCGIAGASAALEAAKAGLETVVITKSAEPEESNTFYAQGGIVAFAPDDRPGLLKTDILEAGDNVGDPAAVDILVADGPKLVHETLIEKLKIPFTRSSPDALDLAQEAGHSRRRILHVEDATGRMIEDRFLRALRKHPNVTLFAGRTAIDLLTVPHHSKNPVAYYREPRAIGAYVLDNATGEVSRVFAPFTVLATGGCGAVFLHTSNPPGADGSGYAMALRAGARIGNMEYIQFHPTVFRRENGDGFLISEAVRGEGARLKTRDGRTFMEKYSPRRDLAPRDEVARAIYEEMIVTNSNSVLLDLASYAKGKDIRERFPTIYKTCLDEGVDITRSPIPVVPAAHYSCGGVLVDAWGQTSLGGLYAVGEVACTGVHGANRLASTSLLEGLVWGTRAARDIAMRFDDSRPYKGSEIHRWYHPKDEEVIDPALVNQDWLTIRSTMWNYAGIIRTRKRLNRAKSDLEYLSHRIEKFYQAARLEPDLIGLRHGILVALMIARAALANPVSRGAHFIKE